MLITSVLAAAAPAPQTHAPPAPAPQHPFASLLRQSLTARPALPPTARPAPAPLPPKAAEPAKPAASANKADSTGTPAAAQPPAPPRPNGADSPARADDRNADAKPSDSDAAPAQRDEADSERSEAGKAKPGKARSGNTQPGETLMPWLPGPQAPADASGLAWPGAGSAMQLDASDAGNSSDSDTGDAGNMGRRGLPALGRGAGAEDARGTDTLQQRAADLAEGGLDPTRPHEAAAPDAAAALVLLERPERRFKPAALEAAHGAAIVGTPAPVGNGSAAAAPTAIALSTPLDAPDFAQALGAQLTLLAKDGVQRAELHLNPAEMGPVSVHIVMAGSHARVEFGADLAATRQVLEAGLPELAGALREAGLTLTGGGVSQHAHGRGDGTAPQGGGGSDRRGSADAATATDTERPLRRLVPAGGVDLYA